MKQQKYEMKLCEIECEKGKNILQLQYQQSSVRYSWLVFLPLSRWTCGFKKKKFF